MIDDDVKALGEDPAEELPTKLKPFALPLSLGTILCIILVLDSAFHISMLIGLITLASVCLASLVVIKTLAEEVPFYSAVAPSIVLLSFVQTFFWVIDYQNPMHEPRSVFLGAIAVGLAYYRQTLLDLSDAWRDLSSFSFESIH